MNRDPRQARTFDLALLPHGPFRLWHVLAAFVATVPILSLLSVVAAASPMLALGIFPMTFGLAAITVVALLSIVKRRSWFQHFSLDAPDVRKALIWGLVGGVAHMIVVYLYEAVMGMPHISPEETAKTLRLGEGVVPGATFLFSSAFVAPIFEELMFRGLVFRGVRDGLIAFSDQYLAPRWPQVGAVIVKSALLVATLVSAYLFMDLHKTEGASFSSVLVYSFMAIITVILFVATGSLLTAIVAHGLNNAVILTVELSHVGGPVPAWLVALPAVLFVLMVLASVGLGTVFARSLPSRPT